MIKGIYIDIDGDAFKVVNGKVVSINGFENCFEDWEDEDFDFDDYEDLWNDEDEDFSDTYGEDWEDINPDDLILELLNFD